MTTEANAYETPLLDRLRSVPFDARDMYSHGGPLKTRLIPYGRHCHDAAAEIARLQAQVDALAGALVSAVGAMDLVEDSILGAQRKRKPDSDGWYSEQMHKDEMDRVTQTKKQCEKALNSAGR